MDYSIHYLKILIPLIIPIYFYFISKNSTAKRLDQKVNEFLKTNVFPKKLKPKHILKAAVAFCFIPLSFSTLGLIVQVLTYLISDQQEAREANAYIVMIGAMPFFVAVLFIFPLVGYVGAAVLTVILPYEKYGKRMEVTYGVQIGFRKVLFDSLFLVLILGSFFFFWKIGMTQFGLISVAIWSIGYWAMYIKYFGRS